MPKKKFKRCVTLLIDGFPTSELEAYLKQGLLPNIKALINEGTYVPTCVSTFPSVTGPAHVPLFTGQNPFHYGIAGHNQFYRNYRCFDNYLVQYANFNKQFGNEKTVYDYYDNSISIAELVYKGSGKFVRYISGVFAWVFRSDINTTLVLRRMLKEYDEGRDLIVGWLTNSDAFPHICKSDRKLKKLMKKVDNFIGDFMARKDKDTRLIICSDHGMEKTDRRFKIKKSFQEMGLNIAKMKFNYDGGGFAQIYFKHLNKDTFWRHKMSYKHFRKYALDKTNFKGLMKQLAKAKAIEFLMVDHEDDTYIFSSRGVASISKKSDKYLYKVLEGKDPFGYSHGRRTGGGRNSGRLVGRWVTKDECLKFSHDTKYPDAIYQVHGLLQLANTGELVITSSDHVSFNFITPYAVHGGLRPDQMVIPFILSDRVEGGGPEYMRSEEVFDYIIGRR
jgi:hypothetical protein